MDYTFKIYKKKVLNEVSMFPKKGKIYVLIFFLRNYMYHERQLMLLKSCKTIIGDKNLFLNI